MSCHASSPFELFFGRFITQRPAIDGTFASATAAATNFFAWNGSGAPRPPREYRPSSSPSFTVASSFVPSASHSMDSAPWSNVPADEDIFSSPLKKVPVIDAPLAAICIRNGTSTPPAVTVASHMPPIDGVCAAAGWIVHAAAAMAAATSPFAVMRRLLTQKEKPGRRCRVRAWWLLSASGADQARDGAADVEPRRPEAAPAPRHEQRRQRSTSIRSSVAWFRAPGARPPGRRGTLGATAGGRPEPEAVQGGRRADEPDGDGHRQGRPPHHRPRQGGVRALRRRRASGGDAVHQRARADRARRPARHQRQHVRAAHRRRAHRGRSLSLHAARRAGRVLPRRLQPQGARAHRVDARARRSDRRARGAEAVGRHVDLRRDRGGDADRRAPPPGARRDRDHLGRRRHGEHGDAARRADGADAERRVRLRDRDRLARPAADQHARQPAGAARDHQRERRQHRDRPVVGRSRRGDGADRRGAEQPVHARLLVDARRRRQVPQHPRARGRERLPGARAQRLRGRRAIVDSVNCFVDNGRPMDAVDSVRAFNRFYTRHVGALGEHLLDSPYSLTEMRVLYELAHRDAASAADLAGELGLDAGYLSRILARFASRRLIARDPAPADARRTVIRLTPRGRAAFAPYERKTRDGVAAMLAGLSPRRRGALVDAMRTVRAQLDPSAAPPVRAYTLRTHRPGDLGWIVQMHGAIYAREYGYDPRFEAIVARIAADFLERFDPGRERCW